jgi:hypothetical protein
MGSLNSRFTYFICRGPEVVKASQKVPGTKQPQVSYPGGGDYDLVVS